MPAPKKAKKQPARTGLETITLADGKSNLVLSFEACQVDKAKEFGGAKFTDAQGRSLIVRLDAQGWRQWQVLARG